MLIGRINLFKVDVLNGSGATLEVVTGHKPDDQYVLRNGDTIFALQVLNKGPLPARARLGGSNTYVSVPVAQLRQLRIDLGDAQDFEVHVEEYDGTFLHAGSMCVKFRTEAELAQLGVEAV